MVCPSEAEAQCAFLEISSLTQGTITDDNDVFLFGGNKVYRRVFSTNYDMEYYCMSDVCSLLGLDRDKLIVLAYLLGSDYTDGIESKMCLSLSFFSISRNLHVPFFVPYFSQYIFSLSFAHTRCWMC